jgi:protein-S-isoprenylcysteine O-methyltransferase Ste14
MRLKGGLVRAVAPALCIVAPVGLAPERLLHPAPWMLVLCLSVVYATQPAARGAWRDAGDRHSAIFILISTAIASLTAVVDFTARQRLIPPPLSLPVAFGVLLAVAGVGLRLWSIRSLGPRFTALVAPPQTDGLVERGPYARIRHPAYAGVLIAQVGMCVMFASPLAGAAVAGLVLPAYLFRIRLEEDVLIARLGKRYLDYRCRTGALLPKASGRARERLAR